MTDQKQVYTQMMEQGFALLSPTIGPVMYSRGDEYRDANGKPAKMPEAPKPSADETLVKLASEALPGMTPGKLAVVAMGEDIDHGKLGQILDGNADVILSEYTNADMKSYLEKQGIEVGNENKAGLLQLVEALHA